MSAVAQRYNVGGVYMPWPFKVRRLSKSVGTAASGRPPRAAGSTAIGQMLWNHCPTPTSIRSSKARSDA